MSEIPRLVPRGAGLQRLQDTRESPTKAPPAAQALKRAAPRAAEASRAGVERPVTKRRNGKSGVTESHRMGRPPKANALSNADRQRLYRQRKAAK